MKLNLLIVGLFIIVGFSAAQEYDEYPNCNCVTLDNCPELHTKLRELRLFRIKHKLFTEYLKGINCGYEWKKPMVCCPSHIPSDIHELLMSEDDLSHSKEVNNLKKVKCNLSKTKKPLFSSKISEDESPPSPEKGGKFFSECGRDLNRDRHFGNKTDLSDFPWLALLEYDTLDGKKLLCGGVLISEEYILTAAHCVTSSANRLTSVILGEYDTSTKIDCTHDGNSENTSTCIDVTKKFDVDHVIIHEGYNDGISHRDPDELYDSNDIALIKIKGPVEFSYYIQPICMPRHKPIRQKFFVSGWGKSMIPDAEGFNRKLMSKLTELKSDTCRNNPRMRFIDEQHICAGFPNRREEPCIADSGGALMGYEKKKDGSYKITIFGISYMDMSCKRPDLTGNLPGVFTSVHKYKQWIRQHIQSG